MGEPLCPKCKREYPEGWTKELSRRRSASIKAAIARGQTIGRKRIADYSKIWADRDAGLSLSRLANKYGVSLGSIQYALRRRPDVEGVKK